MKLPQKDNHALGVKLPGPDIEYVPSLRRVRAFLGGKAVADSRRAVLKRVYPWMYYFPPADVNMDYLEAEDDDDQDPRLWTVRVGEAVAERAAFAFDDDADDAPDLSGYIAFKWDQMDAWFEEDEQIHVHPRDPYSRLDARQSSRHVRIEVGGETVAETNRPVLLFETNAPARFYISPDDVRRKYLVPSDNHTGCPYKGTASYYSLQVGDEFIEDAAWYYPFPYPEMGKIQNLIAFYPKKVDGFYVDGQAWEE
jgi:uncharacterized protein (DUF427 family)